jgi:dTDP-4-amino-4,6-dideoxygalactose transaminase
MTGTVYAPPGFSQKTMSDPPETGTIPFHRSPVGEEEVAAVAEVIRSGWLTMGKKTLEFEERFASYVGARHAVSVCSGTAALHLALETCRLKPGDEVLIPTTTFTATGEVVSYLGARPVLVDIDPVTMNINPSDARKRITARTRAIMPVHMAGQPCDLEELHAIAEEHRLFMVEDAAHALPSEYNGRRIGSFSGVTAFSFYATKTLTTGEGGMIATDSDEHAARMRMMRLHGISGDAWKRYGKNGSWFYEVMESGFKYNLTDLQSAIGLVQLGKCDTHQDARSRIAGLYSAAFKEMAALEIPVIKSGRKSSWHLYILRLQPDQLRIDRNAFIERLKERGIATSVHFIPLHLHPYYQRAFGYNRGDFPVAEREFERCISLPIYPGLTDRDVNQIIGCVREIAHRARS